MKEQKYTKEDYRELSKLPLDRKIMIAQTRIIETFARAKEENKQATISFSGGIDSTILLDIVRKIEPNCKAIYVDTGMEIPNVKEFALSFDNVEVIKPQYCKVCTNCKLGCYGRVNTEKGWCYPNKRDVCESRGIQRNIDRGFIKRANKIQRLLNERKGLQEEYPFIKFSAKCCDVLKKDTIKRYNKENDIFAQFVGVKAFESMNRYMSWRNNGCNFFDKQQSRPLSIWNNQDNFEYIMRYNLPYCKEWYGEPIPNKSGGYKWSKSQRSGCYGCVIGFTDDFDEIEDMNMNYPEMYEKVMSINGYKELYEYTKEGRKYYETNKTK